MGLAFIAHLGYTSWLELSREKVSGDSPFLPCRGSCRGRGSGEGSSVFLQIQEIEGQRGWGHPRYRFCVARPSASEYPMSWPSGVSPGCLLARTLCEAGTIFRPKRPVL
jgi:hypothetical protein